MKCPRGDFFLLQNVLQGFQNSKAPPKKNLQLHPPLFSQTSTSSDNDYIIHIFARQPGTFFYYTKSAGVNTKGPA